MTRTAHILWLLAICAVTAACGPDRAQGPGETASEPDVEWAIAIHGGAGVIERSMDDGERDGYLASLDEALRIGQRILASGGTSLDAVEQVILSMEDDPQFNAGKGAVFNHLQEHELDASIMDGRELACGAVAAVTTIKNPIVLARLVMERTPHVLLAGAGAEQFADEVDVERVPRDYFSTPGRLEQLERQRREARGPDKEQGTVGVAALDSHGNLAAGTSTGGLTGKRFGRIGDSPIIGAGTFADNRTCAVSATGQGEEFIRHGVARVISAMMEYAGATLQEAADATIHGRLSAGDGGVVAVGRDGSIAMVLNTEGLYRGAADSSGRFEVQIWD